MRHWSALVTSSDLSTSFFYSFALHENSRELHAYTRKQKKEGNDFDGELNNFQQPKLRGLAKLVGLCYLWLISSLIALFPIFDQNMDDIFDL